MTDTYSTPDDTGDIHASELHASLGERLGAQASEAFMGGFNLIGHGAEYLALEHGGESMARGFASQQPGVNPAPIDVPIADAQARLKQEGLAGQLTLPDQPTMRQGVLDLMVLDARERRDREAAIARGPQGFVPGALGMVTEIGAGMIDPVNMAAFSIPVLGEARWGQMLASAGESLTQRAGVKALQGGLQGAVGSAALIPGDWWLHTKDGQDYTMADALKSVVMGAGMGATFHAGFGAFGDVRARARGLPLPGSPEDLVLRGLMHGTHVPAAALESEGLPAEDIPGIGVARPVASGGAPQLEAGPAPEPAPGTTRFYHGGVEYSGGPRWLTPDLEYARGYARGGMVHYVDLPNDSPFLRKSFEDQGTDQVAPYVSFEAPEAIAKGLRPLPEPIPPHPAEILADLPPAAREDAYRATAADVIAGRPARTAEMLQEAAKEDPRIAESLSPDQRQSTGPGGDYPGDDEHTSAAADIPAAAAEDGNVVHVAARKASGPRARPEATRSLFEHIAANGGLRADDPMIPDVKSSLGRDNHFAPGFGNLIRKPGQVSTAAARSGARAPMSLDAARESAVHAGYLEDQGAHTGGVSTSTVRHLLDAIDTEARGTKVYRNGAEPPRTARDQAQHEHELNNAMDKGLGDYGVDLDRIPSKTRDRTLEIMDREGVTDPLDAYERAVMEETQHGAQAGEHERIPETIPGWDVHDEPGAAPGAGGAAPPGGERGAGDAARDAGQGDRAAGRPGAATAGGLKGEGPSSRDKADFRKFADGKRAVDDPDDVAASKAAEATPEPQSIEPAKAVSAAEAAAKEADQLVADILPTLSDKERKIFEDALRELKDDKEARDQVVRDGAACLAAAVA